MVRLSRLVIVQARTGSTRLPGKVLLDLAGRPLLGRMIDRLSRASRPDGIVVGTTRDPLDDPIVAFCEREGWECFRGDTDDLLDRHYRCALEYGADVVAKIPSDVPLIDPSIVDAMFSFYDEGNFDYVSNLHPPTFPDGLDVEVLSIDALRTAWAEATKDYEREHTTPYIWDNPERFRLGNLETPNEVDYSLTYRWTIDYPEDYEFLCRVFSQFCAKAGAFTWMELVAFLEAHPEVVRINADRIGISWYRKHLHDLKHVQASWTQKS